MGIEKRVSSKGINTLLNQELLEILIGKNKSKKLLKHNECLSKILDFSDKELKEIVSKDFIKVKAIRELITRYFESKVKISDVLSSPEAVGYYLSGRIGNKKREEFLVLFLNSKNEVIADKILFTGDISKAQIYPKVIMKEALLLDATAIICAHNHPSGNKYPSDDDITLTKKLKSLLSDIDIYLHDHIVVTKNTQYSIEAQRFIN